jgi:hypothetical protein
LICVDLPVSQHLNKFSLPTRPQQANVRLRLDPV